MQAHRAALPQKPTCPAGGGGFQAFALYPTPAHCQFPWVGLQGPAVFLGNALPPPGNHFIFLPILSPESPPESQALPQVSSSFSFPKRRGQKAVI